MSRVDYQRVDHVLRVHVGQPRGFVRGGVAVDHAAQVYPALLRVHLHLVAGQGLRQRFAQAGDVHVRQHGEEFGLAGNGPHHQTAYPRGFGGDNNFLRGRGHGIEHHGIADVDAAELLW